MVSRPNPIDVHVGSRVRIRRTLLGMSQDRLGKEIGLTFQQVQKYERGANRIGSSRLYELSRVLDVPISFFFDDLPGEVVQKYKGAGEDPPEDYEHEEIYDPKQMSRRETLELVRAYYKIPEAAVRKRVFDMVKAIAAQPQPEDE